MKKFIALAGNLALAVSFAAVSVFAAGTTATTASSTPNAKELEAKKLKEEYDIISYKNKIDSENMKIKSKEIDDLLQKLTTENKLKAEQQKKNLAEIHDKIAKLKAESDLLAEQNRVKNLKIVAEKDEIDLATKRMEFEEKKIRHENEMLRANAEKLRIELEMRAKKEDWKKQSNSEPVYLAEPFNPKTGTLTVSDRRIPFNVVVSASNSDFVVKRIAYFNNISTAPIFIMIDTNLGGSVAAGYGVIKAMESSKAPVYVVVKSFAASMAAIITTMADRSFIYQNATILHHQMSSRMHRSNTTQIKEYLSHIKEYERRIFTPVAKKMGLTLDALRKKMYEHNSDGDWEEYGDNAVKLHWATNVVNKIHETGIVKEPEEPRFFSFSLLQASEEKVDANGSKYVSLPRLAPFDFYHIYNPDNYFRFD